MTAESTTPCVKCGSFAVQRRSEGLFCLVCATKRSGIRTRTTPIGNMRPQGSPPVGGVESVVPCPKCQSTAIQKKADGSYCLVCGQARRDTDPPRHPISTTKITPRGDASNSGPESVSPCPQCQSTALQRRNDGLYCLICSRKVVSKNPPSDTNPKPRNAGDQQSVVASRNQSKNWTSPERRNMTKRKVRMTNFHIQPWLESASAARNLQQAMDQLADRDPEVAEILDVFDESLTFEQAINVFLNAWNRTNNAMRKIGLEPVRGPDDPYQKINSLIELHLGRWLR